MSYCFRCGRDKESQFLSEVITREGIKNVCKDCISEENFPLVKKTSDFDFSELEKKNSTVYERLSVLSGVRHNKKPEVDDFIFDSRKDKKDPIKTLAEDNYISRVKKTDNAEGMIHNFHWIIMRARRAKKLSQKQFAEKIGETESSVKLAEKGILPSGHYRFAKKIENFLGIRIMLSEFKKKFETNQVSGSFDVENSDMFSMTIGGLKNINIKKRQKNIPLEQDYIDEKNTDQHISFSESNYSGDSKEKTEFFPQNKDVEDEKISQEEIDRIIFGSFR